MLKSNERLCKCGCGQIIWLSGYYITKENINRNSYYANKYHLPKKYNGIEDWSIKEGYIKEVNKGCD